MLQRKFRFSGALVASIVWAVLAVGCGGGEDSAAMGAESAAMKAGTSASASAIDDAEVVMSMAGGDDGSEALVAEESVEREVAEELGGAVAWPIEDFRTSSTGDGNTRERPLAATATNVDEGYVPGCNRAPGDDFIDGGTWNNRRLLPRDCEVLKYNPPMFGWRVPPDMDASAGWSFTLKRADGSSVVSKKLTQAYYRHGSALPAGDYNWQVSYKSKRSAVGTVVSDVRVFRVPAGADVFLPPDGQTIAAKVAAKARPRILPSGKSFKDIRDLVSSGEYSSDYQDLLYLADRAAEDPLPAEPDSPPSKGTSSWSKWREATQRTANFEGKDIEILAFSWQMSGNARFRNAGLERLLNIARWDPNGSTSDKNHDSANAILALSIARGFDMYRAELTASQRTLVVKAVKARIAQIVPQFENLEIRPYDSHGIEQIRMVTEALLWMAGEEDFSEARTWLVSAWDDFVRFLDVWGDADGGFGNGIAYGWFAQNDSVEMLVLVRSATGFDIGRHPWVRNFPDFLMANTTPSSAHFSSTGDSAELENLYGTYAHNWTRLYSLITGSAQQSWYWRQGTSSADKYYISPFHFIAYAMAGGSPPPKAPTQHSWLFRDAGMVAIHDRPDAAATRSTVHFRSSRFGSFNHSFADQNAFALTSRGRSLLIAGGYYPWFLSNHHALVGRATRYKNALTFDGGIGQAEPVPAPTSPGKPMQSMDARGEIVDFQSKGPWTAATGDATLAYRGWNKSVGAWTPLLTSAVRTVAYNRTERVLVVYDYASSAKARAFELNFNALAPFKADGDSVRVDYDGAAACIRVYGADGAFSTSSGFAVAPERPRPQQYQARFKAKSSTSLAAVTVIREDCRNVAVTVNKSGTSFGVKIGSADPIALDRGGTVLP